MGNWTITDGITNAYDSLEQDVEEIKNYRIAIVVVSSVILASIFNFYRLICSNHRSLNTIRMVTNCTEVTVLI